MLQQVCCIEGLGGLGGTYRDGTPGYYLSEVLNDDDIKGVGPLMMAQAECLLCKVSPASSSQAVA